MTSKLFPYLGEVTVLAVCPPENPLLKEEGSRARMSVEKLGAIGHFPTLSSSMGLLGWLRQ